MAHLSVALLGMRLVAMLAVSWAPSSAVSKDALMALKLVEWMDVTMAETLAA